MVDNSRKVRHLRITKQALAGLLRIGPHWVDVSRGLPEDAYLGGIYFDYNSNIFYIEVFSDTFEVVSEGHIIPWFGDIIVSGIE